MLKFNVYQLKQLVNLIANAKASIINGVALVIFTIVALNFSGCSTSEKTAEPKINNGDGFLSSWFGVGPRQLFEVIT